MMVSGRLGIQATRSPFSTLISRRRREVCHLAVQVAVDMRFLTLSSPQNTSASGKCPAAQQVLGKVQAGLREPARARYATTLAPALPRCALTDDRSVIPQDNQNFRGAPRTRHAARVIGSASAPVGGASRLKVACWLRHVLGVRTLQRLGGYCVTHRLPLTFLYFQSGPLFRILNRP